MSASLAISELFQTIGVAVAAYVLITGIAWFLKAESATWSRKDSGEAP